MFASLLCAFAWSKLSFRLAAFVGFIVFAVVCVAEVFFWYEFEERLDRLVFHYLAYPMEVLEHQPV